MGSSGTAAAGTGEAGGTAPGTGSAADPWQRLLTDAVSRGRPLAGFHNSNYVLERAGGHARLLDVDPGTPLKVRVRRGALTVVERAWSDEGAILAALDRTEAVRGTPRHYAGAGEACVHEYVPGVALSQVCPPGKPLERRYVEAVAAHFASFGAVRLADLPPLPAGWAADGDSRAFLLDRVRFTDTRVRGAHEAEYGGLLGALGVPERALGDYAARLPALTRRPFALLHADLHRGNLIVRDDGDLAVVDWELALWGDPLHDLAVHLVRTGYPDDQRDEAVRAWRDAVEPAAAAGLADDLPVYIGYEYAQSLYADTLRAAHGLSEHPEPAALDAAARWVRDALWRAAAPLRLDRVPTLTEVERALLAWARRRAGGRS